MAISNSYPPTKSLKTSAPFCPENSTIVPPKSESVPFSGSFCVFQSCKIPSRTMRKTWIIPSTTIKLRWKLIQNIMKIECCSNNERCHLHPGLRLVRCHRFLCRSQRGCGWFQGSRPCQVILECIGSHHPVSPGLSASQKISL